MRRWLGVLAAGVLLTGGEGAAEAGGGQSVEIRLIEGFHTDGGTSVDATLDDLPQLTQEQPFVRYNVYRLLDARRFPLQEGATLTYGLVNGRTLRVTLASVVEARPQRRYRMSAQILDPGRKAFLKDLHVTAGENQPFFVGGQQFQGGVLFIEVVVRG